MTNTPADPEVADADRANGEPAATADDGGREAQPNDADDAAEHKETADRLESHNQQADDAAGIRSSENSSSST